MIDTVKRQTLKRIGLSAVAVTVAGVAGRSIASVTPSSVSGSVAGSLPLSDIQVSTRVSAINNDLEVLITNTGNLPTRITQLTPSVTMTKRGQFDFGRLMKDGDIALASGQSLSVPMQPHTVQANASDTSNQQAQSLSEALRRSFSVITENDSFAKVTVIDGIRFV
jgi:hypothetical protein